MQWLTMLCQKDINEQCNLTALPDTRSRGLSRFFICNVRSGELCFGLIVREDEPGEYKLFTNLYVSGIDTGYGQRKREPIFGEKNMILSKKLRNL